MNVFITGATGGIGSHIAEALAREGARLFLHYHDEEKKKTAEERFKKTLTNPPHFLKADLMVEAQTNALLDVLVAAGGVDILVHCVSLPLERKAIFAKEWVDFERHFTLQAKSLFLMVKRLAPLMQERSGGRIVSIVSAAVTGAPPVNLSDYVVGKYALLGLTTCIAAEYGRFNIRCNALSPGFVDTDLHQGLPDRFRELAALRSPHGRILTAEEVGAAVRKLCFDSDAPNGAHIVLHGGVYEK